MGMGVIFSPESSLSKAISNSAEFKAHIQKNILELAKGDVIKEASTYFGSDKNLKLALGHADILYTTLTENGDLYALVLDTYDFNAGDPDWKVRIARATQDGGIIRNYYTLNIVEKWYKKMQYIKIIVMLPRIASSMGSII
jgi:hypothetical protein